MIYPINTYIYKHIQIQTHVQTHMTLEKHPTYSRSIFITKKTPSSIITKTIRYNQTNPQCKTIFFKPLNNYTKPMILPVKLTYLKLNDYYWEPLILPKTIRYFSSGYTWDQPLVLPKIKKLILGDSYTQFIHLPKTIVYFEIGLSFDHSINLPNKLHTVIFGERYTQPVFFPKSIMYLRIGWFHVKTSALELPPRLKSLVFGQYLVASPSFEKCILPSTLQVLSTPYFSNISCTLPENVHTIKIFHGSEHVQKINEYIDNLPNQIKRLIFTENYFNTSLINLPNKINSIDVHYKSFDKKLICRVPSLKSLRVLANYKDSPESREKYWFIKACVNCTHT